jgi:hypothetical protein
VVRHALVSGKTHTSVRRITKAQEKSSRRPTVFRQVEPRIDYIEAIVCGSLATFTAMRRALSKAYLSPGFDAVPDPASVSSYSSSASLFLIRLMD